MQGPLGTGQTEQWSWILQTVWGWVWGGLSWIVDWQALVFRWVLYGDSFWQVVGKFLLLFFPATVLVLGVWGTMVSLYTIPFRSGRGRFLAALLMSWWDAVRMAWFYWFGLARFLLVFVGWIWGLLRLGVGLFLYRELIDAITPWLAQQGYQLGVVGTLALALLGWVGVRGMTWFLFGRFGAPALLAILGRKAMEGLGAVRAAATADVEFWRGPINALKAEHEWFKKEAQHLMELLTLPVLQLVASGFNFLVVVIMGKPHFNLPFRSLDQVLHSTPIFQTGKTSTVEGGA